MSNNYGRFINDLLNLLSVTVENFNSKPGKSKYILEDSNEKYPIFTEELMDAALYDNSIRLEASTKDQFEYLLNADLSKVRIHTGKYAEILARNAGAFAVTIGNDIYFARGYYSPDTEEGMKLLAHELQHVVQNSRGDRHIYHEDISAAEHEAGKIEELMTPSLLFDIPSLGKKPSLELEPTPFPYPNTGGSDKSALKKSSLQSLSDSLADFSKQKEKKCRVILKDGSSVMLSQKDMSLLSQKFREMVQEWVTEEAALRDNEEFQQTLVNFLD